MIMTRDQQILSIEKKNTILIETDNSNFATDC